MIITYILTKLKQFFSQLSAKDIVYLFVIICLLILTRNGCGHRKDPNTEVKKPVLQSTEQKVDKKGTAYTEIKGTMYTQEQMDAQADSFRRVLKKGKVVAVEEEATPDTVYIDTSKVVYVDTTTGHMMALDSTKNYKIGFDGNYRLHTGTFSLHLTPDTSTRVTTLKTHWFKPDEMTVNTYHTNSLFVPSTGTAYMSTVPKPIVDFDLFFGYDFLHMQPCIAAGAGLHIFSIKRKH